MAFREVGGVGGDFVGNQPLFDILFVGQAEMLFRRDIARMAQPNQPIIAAPIPEVKWS